ncbi:amidohydrolase family protein [Pedobacter ginsengisoli]|uniref:amidohydrolase family protein n=1 Tax=Pedobacter ginsengisoli TaxID=363852 RepID=UPI00254F50F4|nr:amidohydrolase family protein [Pedobacter ginsengisoli]
MNTRIQNIPLIDSHLHLWDVELLDYPWLQDVPEINKSFSITDYQDETKDLNIEKMIFVQCECLPEQSMEEIRFVEQQALKDPRIRGMVAYAPLEKGSEIIPTLALFKQHQLVRGVRRMYDDTPEICTDPDFLTAVRLLPEYGLSMDLSIKPSSAAQTLLMIRACPDTQFVLDHLGKPDIKNDGFNKFRQDMDAFASLPNVVAKISGLLTETNWYHWSEEEVGKYIAYAIGCFGPDRLMFGGDWPVVLLAGTYNQWLQTLFKCVRSYTDEDIHKLFYDTANKIYRI